MNLYEISDESHTQNKNYYSERKKKFLHFDGNMGMSVNGRNEKKFSNRRKLFD